jgi:Uma2 family endonuclease
MREATPRVSVSYEEYLVGETTSEDKHEWLDGIVYAMSRGTPEHGRLTANVTAALRSALKGVCSVYAADTMLFVRETNLSTYADASVTCGAVETHRVVKNGRALGEAITNPVVIVEVLSDGTQEYDRGEKFGHSMRIPSLAEYILVSQNEVRVEILRRPDGPGHWVHEIAIRGQAIVVHGQTIAVDDIYDK